MKDFATAVEILSKGNNKVFYVDRGDGQYLPSIMVRLPWKNVKDMGLPGQDYIFRSHYIQGQKYKFIWVSKYPNTIVDGKALSLPLVAPTYGATIEQMYNAARYNDGALNESGLGWHVMTALEYAYLASRHYGSVNGVRPVRGNVDYDITRDPEAYAASSAVNFYTGENGTYLEVFEAEGQKVGGLQSTGSGKNDMSDTFKHDGVFDIVGGLYEWAYGIALDGYKLKLGMTLTSGSSTPSVYDNSALLTEGIDTAYYYYTGSGYADSDTGAYRFGAGTNSVVLTTSSSATAPTDSLMANSALTINDNDNAHILSELFKNHFYGVGDSFGIAQNGYLTWGGAWKDKTQTPGIGSWNFKALNNAGTAFSDSYVGFRSAYIDPNDVYTGSDAPIPGR